MSLQAKKVVSLIARYIKELLYYQKIGNASRTGGTAL